MTRRSCINIHQLGRNKKIACELMLSFRVLGCTLFLNSLLDMSCLGCQGILILHKLKVDRDVSPILFPFWFNNFFAREFWLTDSDVR